VPSGDHTVDLTFDPTSVMIGRLASLTGLAITGALVVGFRRERGRGRVRG
jgi:hypothetical protein